MNTFQAINDAMSIALATDDTACVFGEDVGFGGVFRCTMGLAEMFGKPSFPAILSLTVDSSCGCDD